MRLYDVGIGVQGSGGEVNKRLHLDPRLSRAVIPWTSGCVMAFRVIHWYTYV